MIETDREVVYSNSVVGVTIYKAKWGDIQEVAVKEQTASTLSAANEAIRESHNQTRLDHPNICKIYQCYFDTTYTKGYRYVILMEWMERDVFTAIKERQLSHSQWPESDLWRFLGELTEALAYAQSKGISHRDIKPQNIFLNSRGVIKIGDFGASKWQSADVNQQTIQGTPFFLSPALRSHYRTFIATGDPKVTHNQYKSDVYSLGLTFLFMATLVEPRELTNLSSLQAVTDRKIAKIPYSDRMKFTLRSMLTVDEESRPDFLSLLRELNLSERNGLSQFRLGMRPSDREAMCPKCGQQPLAQAGDGIFFCPVASCGYGSEVIAFSLEQPQVGDCMVCHKRFLQSSVGPWRSRLAATYSKDASDFSDLCSEDCAVRFLQFLSEDTPGCVFCRSRSSAGKVALHCNAQHFFCSKLCFLLYAMKCTHNFSVQALIRCPVCLEFVTNEQLQAIFEGKLWEEVMKYREEHCAECSATGEIAERQRKLPCHVHFLCEDCKSSALLSRAAIECRYCEVAEPAEQMLERAASS